MTAPLTVDDLVTGRAAEALGPGIIPTKALLIVETISEDGPGLRYIRTDDLATWQALGVLRSTLLALEAVDLDSWADVEEDE